MAVSNVIEVVTVVASIITGSVVDNAIVIGGTVVVIREVIEDVITVAIDANCTAKSSASITYIPLINFGRKSIIQE
ncbi:MAG: hypothetical protein MTP17_02535 [Candidatus Midichloria sp.]|nr:MAG: hypothetical protein MTP17_02535 [Candidatus Midichloria sp.]